MKDKLDIYRGIQDILPTMEEALRHILKQIAELRFEESLGLLTDFADGVCSVDNAIKVLPGMVCQNKDILNQSLKAVIESYEERNSTQSEETVQRLLVDFFNWKSEIEQSLCH